MSHKRSNPDQIVARIAARQHGVVTIAQLIAAGLSRDAVKRRVATGRLHRIHRGVYAVGHRALSFEGRWKAATLALGDGAVLSHRSAAELWELLSPRSGPIHVTVPGSGGRRKRRGLQVHRTLSLPKAARTSRDGIAVTTPARRDCGLVVEVDGYRAHGGRQAFEDDHVREAHLARHGLEVRRFSARQVTEEPRTVAATIRAIRARRARA